MKCSFVEYDSSAGPVQLHIIVRDACEQNLINRLRVLADCAGVDEVGDGLVAVRADYEADMDDFLRRVSRLITANGAEIVESRLCSTAYESGPVAISKRFIALAPGMSDEKNSGLPAPMTRVMPLYLESGTSFGSGQHPSTRLAVEALEHVGVLENSFPRRVLDIGCGSGILSLVCAKLGARRVMGLDIDPAALVAARHNVRLNGEDNNIIIADSPLADIKMQFDLLVANISPFVLLGLISELPRFLSPNGIIVLAGMRKAQLGDIRRILQREGLSRNEQIYTDGQWVGMLNQL